MHANCLINRSDSQLPLLPLLTILPQELNWEKNFASAVVAAAVVVVRRLLKGNVGHWEEIFMASNSHVSRGMAAAILIRVRPSSTLPWHWQQEIERAVSLRINLSCV